MLLPILGPSSLPAFWWPRLTKGIQIEQLMCLNDLSDTEHTTSGSNEVVAV